MFNSHDGKIKVAGIRELYYLTAINNVSSILTRGLLSHVRANKLSLTSSSGFPSTTGGQASSSSSSSHVDMSNHEVQDRREERVIERAQNGYIYNYRLLFNTSELPKEGEMCFSVRNNNILLYAQSLAPVSVDPVEPICNMIKTANSENRDFTDEEKRVLSKSSFLISRIPPHSKPLNLHRFVNLFLNPNNAMILAIYNQGQGKPSSEMCIIRINREILQRGDVILTDQNASTDGAGFYTTNGFTLDEAHTEYLSNPISCFFKKEAVGEAKEKQRKHIRQAEALVPYKIDVSYITGFFVSCKPAYEQLFAILAGRLLPVEVKPDIFFQGLKDRKASAGSARSMPNIRLVSFNPATPPPAPPNSSYPDSSDDEDDHDRSLQTTLLHR